MKAILYIDGFEPQEVQLPEDDSLNIVIEKTQSVKGFDLLYQSGQPVAVLALVIIP
jgi:hypothetical protein